MKQSKVIQIKFENLTDREKGKEKTRKRLKNCYAYKNAIYQWNNRYEIFGKQLEKDNNGQIKKRSKFNTNIKNSIKKLSKVIDEFEREVISESSRNLTGEDWLLDYLEKQNIKIDYVG